MITEEKKRVYIYDEVDNREIIADLIESVKMTGHEKEVKYELKNIIFYSAGELLAEILSIDDNAIKKSIKCAIENEDVYATILPPPFAKFGLLDDSEMIYPINCISAVREFIDLIGDTPNNNLSPCVRALWDFLDAWDSLPEYGQKIKKSNIYEDCYWKEFTYFYTYNDEASNFPSPFDLEFDSSKLREKLHISLEEYNNDEEYNNKFPNFSLNISRPAQLIFASLEQCLAHDVLIKKCKNCGKYFAPQNRSDTLYCDRRAPQDEAKTCKEYGARQAWKTTLKDNESAGLYRKIYMSKQMQAKRNPENKDYLASFENFKQESKQWKADVRAGNKSETEFLEWLKAVKEKRVL